ncbi:hypothetical protein CWI75_13220 [Kineobactrum sediminis]|uniref:PepSY domain-containing protein n=1 Tax=Kineobactrum sediminis TaxID=1905677 RepID=A0A2N5Y0W9_9GAMM|nr:hypothetical protein [Kineobactrum sediminis]PLW82037.1 hypothetical protein CWI75_13220 [Kineobactrum sediminis]
MRTLSLATRVVTLLLLAGSIAGPGAMEVWAQRDSSTQQQPRLSAAEAAARAQARYGGEVLSVTPQGAAWRVRLLLESGRVITVTVRD